MKIIIPVSQANLILGLAGGRLNFLVVSSKQLVIIMRIYMRIMLLRVMMMMVELTLLIILVKLLLLRT